MKKLKLNLQQFEGAEVLTRSQLKKVMGGDGGSGGGCDAGTCQWGTNCFYQSGSQCGIAHCLGDDGYGNCQYTIENLGDCGWT
jgi:hypothetical protein